MTKEEIKHGTRARTTVWTNDGKGNLQRAEVECFINRQRSDGSYEVFMLSNGTLDIRFACDLTL